MRRISPESHPPAASPERTLARSAPRWVVRSAILALAMLVMAPSLLLVSAQPALAGFVDVNEKSWSRTDAGVTYTLTARIAIETDGAGSGRLRFRLQCFRNGAPHTCAFQFASGSNAYWCNTQPPNQSSTPPAACVTRHLDNRSGSDEYWFGTWHTMAHQVELVHARNFRAVFNNGAGPTGVYHWIASANAIVKLANQQAANDYSEWGSNCNYYSPGGPGAVCAEWCAMFATWVWDITGVPEVTDEVRRTYVARMLGSWGQQWGNFHRSGPRPGDWVIWGEPGNVTPGHNDIVVQVNGDGSLYVVGGNVANKVTRRLVWPGSSTTNGQPISGYVTPSY
jgi:hypothetical protein